MPSDTHKTVCEQLQDINLRVREVLTRNDYEALPILLRNQMKIMQDLQAAGQCKDPGLMDLLTETRNEVAEITQALKVRRDDLARQIKTAGNKNKLTKAYGT